MTIDTSDPAWRDILRAALVSGSVASVASSAALAVLGEAETGKPARPTNATSQWFWGDEAHRARHADVRHTVTGYLIHHAMSLLWATVYERFRRPDTRQRVLTDAALVAAGAYITDFYLTPKRFTPGFEHHLSRPALYSVYLSFAAGLALATWLGSRRR